MARNATPATTDAGLPIPTELFTVVGRARAIAAGRCGGEARARILGRSGRWLVAHASVLTDPRSGAPDQIAVVLEPANAVEVVPIIVEAFGLTWPDNFVVAEPMGYLDFCRAMGGASILLTDSGGVQEEAVTLDIPCVTLRPNTERMETVFLRANRLFDLEHDEGLARVVASARREHGGRPYKLNPYGDGKAAERIVAVCELLDGREPTVSWPTTPGMADLGALRAAARAALERRGG